MFNESKCSFYQIIIFLFNQMSSVYSKHWKIFLVCCRIFGVWWSNRNYRRPDYTHFWESRSLLHHPATYLGIYIHESGRKITASQQDGFRETILKSLSTSPLLFFVSVSESGQVRVLRWGTSSYFRRLSFELHHLSALCPWPITTQAFLRTTHHVTQTHHDPALSAARFQYQVPARYITLRWVHPFRLQQPWWIPLHGDQQLERMSESGQLLIDSDYAFQLFTVKYKHSFDHFFWHN